MDEKILYFGYGLLASPKFIEALLGRRVRGRKAYLKNYGLFINPWEKINVEVRKRLRGYSWKPGDNFSHYSIKMRRGDRVKGKVYLITPYERRLIEDFNLCSLPWFSPIKILVEDTNQQTVLAETETLMTFDSEIYYQNGMKYTYFLNDLDKIFSVASIFNKEL